MSVAERKSWIGLVLLVFIPGAAMGQSRTRAEAFMGEPFGVGRLDIELPPSVAPEVLGLAGISLVEENGRVFYPATERDAGIPPIVNNVLNQARRPALRILGELLNQPATRTSVCFLFVGRDPLKLTVQTRDNEALVVTPVADPAGYRGDFAAWWRQYTAGPAFWVTRVTTEQYVI